MEETWVNIVSRANVMTGRFGKPAPTRFHTNYYYYV